MPLLQEATWLLPLLTFLAVLATVAAVAMPMFTTDKLGTRMKEVATEREKIRARERQKMKEAGSASLRGGNNRAKAITEALDLKQRLADGETGAKLKRAGFRSENALNAFLVARLIGPFGGIALGVFLIYVADLLEGQDPMVKLLGVVVTAAFGYYLPGIYLTNIATKRSQSIKRAWPDALDLTLICVESGMSIEAAFRRVSEEIGVQSVELAEELVLTTAELSYLPERRMAYNNLVDRTGLPAVKSVVQALNQAEKYGTPVGTALRVLAQESRLERMNAAEKKAHALPPKLTVPMILFFVPVLFIVVLGPPIMSAMDAFSDSSASGNQNPSDE